MSERADGEDPPPGRLEGLAARVIELWALGGGVVLLAVVLVTAWSVTSAALFGQPVLGDVEIVEVGVAIAAFSFLPYCQLTGANVTADIFTERAGARWIGFFSALASAVALTTTAVLIWRMWAGMNTYREYGHVTTILQFPHWIAHIPILASLFLLAAACLITLNASAGEMRGPGAPRGDGVL